MNTHTPDKDPLDEDEQALARIVRALPAGEPPSALDAHILKAASNALAAPTRRRAAWLTSSGSLWGIGSAAAAVLAIGIAWQRMNPALPSLPASAPVPVAADTRDDGRTTVEFKQEAPRRYDNSPPPPALADAPRTRVPIPAKALSTQPMAAPAVAPAAPAPLPQDAMKESLDEHVAAAADRAVAEPAATGGMAKAAPAERDQATADDLADAKERVAADASLYPESWLARIRTRLKDGDVMGARASLRLFVAKYPTQAVPDDLKALLKQ
jgi:hypothetical protein